MCRTDHSLGLMCLLSVLAAERSAYLAYPQSRQVPRAADSGPQNAQRFQGDMTTRIPSVHLEELRAEALALSESLCRNASALPVPYKHSGNGKGNPIGQPHFCLCSFDRGMENRAEKVTSFSCKGLPVIWGGITLCRQLSLSWVLQLLNVTLADSAGSSSIPALVF